LSKRRISAVVFIVLIMCVLVVTIQPVRSAKFVLASWDYPDEHGQGIHMFRFYENSTASWVAAPYYQDGLPYFSLHSYDSYTLNWSAGVAMKLRVYTSFNQTLVGVESTAEWQNYQRHSIVVTSAGQPIFSQQNFTYYDVTEYGEDNYYYEYEVVLNFLPLDGLVYTVTVTYEVFY